MGCTGGLGVVGAKIDGAYTPEAEGIAQCIQSLLDHEFSRDGGSVSTGRIMVTNDHGGGRSVFLELGHVNEYGQVQCDERPDV